MTMRKKILYAALGLSVGLIAMPKSSFAIGGGFGGIPSETVTINDMGPLSGKWQFAGGVDGFGAAWTNPTPEGGLDQGGFGNGAGYSIGLAAIQIHKADGWLHVTYWGGMWQTPATGITSNYGAFNSLARFGSDANPTPGSPTFKWWLTVAPPQTPWFSISGGELASTEGTEIGFDWMNPTPLVSNLNNMQATPGYGVQLNFFYGPLTANLVWNDTYKTDRFNMLSYLLTYNLNSDGSDFIIGFGHTNLGHTGNPAPNFNVQNSSLIGFGAQWIWGPWLFSPEVEYQWLPKNSVTSSNGFAPPQQTYYNVAAMFDLTYTFPQAPKWSVVVQPQVVYQNSDKSDPNNDLYGNWLQFGLPAAPGVFSAGTTLTSLQVGATWDNKNFFIRPDVNIVHLAGFNPGTGYGSNGNDATQVVGLVEIGYLLGK